MSMAAFFFSFRFRVQRAKADLIEKNAEIAKSLQVARREKEVFDRNLAAAKAETLRFRQMVESRSDMDDNFKVRLLICTGIKSTLGPCSI